MGGGETSKEVTGWDIRGWDPTGKHGEDRKAAEEKRGKAQAFFRTAAGESPILTDVSTTEEVDTAALALRETMTATLDKFAKKKRSCARSKRWWTEDLGKLRKELGRARRNWRVADMSRVQAARRELRRAIRKAKRDCWNGFLQEAKGSDIWIATAYTTPRIDKAGQVLVADITPEYREYVVSYRRPNYQKATSCPLKESTGLEDEDTGSESLGRELGNGV